MFELRNSPQRTRTYNDHSGFTMRLTVLTSLTAVTFALSACASIQKSSIQEIEVITPGVQGAYCELTTPKNNYIVVTPGKTSVNRSQETMTVTCSKKPHFPEVSVKIVPRFLEVTEDNILNLGIGALYDYANGAVNGYPKRVVVDLTGHNAHDYGEPARMEFRPSPALTNHHDDEKLIKAHDDHGRMHDMKMETAPSAPISLKAGGAPEKHVPTLITRPAH